MGLAAPHPKGKSVSPMGCDAGKEKSPLREAAGSIFCDLSGRSNFRLVERSTKFDRA
jgi:hypothetical protein